ncbi:MAG: oligosaccharide flippase family protein [Rickettsiaceae bacterium]|nr:oligosaccharide flippase family protein [Rickettsiaceae bacterium]
MKYFPAEILRNEKLKQLAVLTNNSLVGSAASYFLTIYLANHFGSEVFGKYSYILVLSSLSTIFINWASDQTATSYLAEGFSQKEVFDLVLCTRMLIFFIVSFVLLFWVKGESFVYIATLLLNISAFNLSFLYEIRRKNSIYSLIYMLERLTYVGLVFFICFVGLGKLNTVIYAYTFIVVVSLLVQFFLLGYPYISGFSIPSVSSFLFFIKNNFSIVIISFSAFVYGGISRIFIEQKLGLKALGIFSSAMQITVLISIFQAQVERIWRISIFDAFAKQDYKGIVKSVRSFFVYSTIPCILLSLALSLTSSQLVDLFFTKEYVSLKQLLPIVSIFFITINLSSLITICWIAIKRRTEYLISSIISSLVLLGMFAILPATASLNLYFITILVSQLGLIVYSVIRIINTAHLRMLKNRT